VGPFKNLNAQILGPFLPEKEGKMGKTLCEKNNGNGGKQGLREPSKKN